MRSAISQPEINTYFLKPMGNFPNNEDLPVLVYRKAFVDRDVIPSLMESTFNDNGWSNSWRNGIYSYHHYHSNTHEVLGIYSGSIQVQLGGPEGIIINLEKGDVVVLPAGVAHKNIDSSDDFRCVGAYPEGKEYDMNYGNPEELSTAKQNIHKVKFPDKDPIMGDISGIISYWSQA